MKRLQFETGGRPRTLDDMDTLQSSVFDAIEAMFQGKGAFIIQGCTVAGNDIGTGIVFIEGQIMEFAGASGVSFPTYMKKAADQLTVNRTHETGGSKPTQKHVTAELSASLPVSGEYIPMTGTGGRSYWDAVAGEVVRMKGNQTISGTKTFVSDIKVNGKTITQWLDTRAKVGSIFGSAIFPTDFNDLDKTGIYYAAFTNLSSNRPSATKGILIVSQNGNGIYQIHISMTGVIETREKSLSGWTAWS